MFIKCYYLSFEGVLLLKLHKKSKQTGFTDYFSTKIRFTRWDIPVINS